MSVLKVQVLGQLKISNAEDPTLEICSSNRARRIWMLLAYLILHRDREVTSTELFEIMWPEANRVNPLRTLQHNVSRARSLLEETGVPGARDMIVCRSSGYQWGTTCATVVDADDMQRYVSEALKDSCKGVRKAELLQRAIDLYQGDAFSVLDSSAWTETVATQYRMKFISACETLAGIRGREGNWNAVIDICRRGIDVMPENEQLCIMLMEAMIEMGDNEHAMKAYDRLSETLMEELGVKPSDELVAAREDIMMNMMGHHATLDDIRKMAVFATDIRGAQICDRLTFEALVRREMRNVGRTEEKGVLLLVSFDENLSTKVNIRRLTNVLTANLRSGDAFTQINNHQFVALLPEVGKDNMSGITGRIQAAMRQRFPRAGFIPTCEWFALE